MNKLSEHEFRILIEKQKDGVCTPEEEIMLQEWFENVPFFDDVTFVSEEEKAIIEQDIQTRIHKNIAEQSTLRTQPFKKALYQLIWFKAVAAIMTLCLIGGGIYYYLAITSLTKELTLHVPIGIEKLPVSLPDGSKVWLAGGSSFSYPERFDPEFRNVTLEGRAYFTVKPDKQAPFTVTTVHSMAVRVLGTSFVVESIEASPHMQVSVITGLVQVNENNGRLAEVRPGEKLVYSYGDKNFTKTHLIAHETSSWEDSSIRLDNVSLNDLKMLLHTNYNIQMEFEVQETSDYRFTMSYNESLSLDEVLGMLKETSGLNFLHKGDKVLVSN